MQFEIAMTSGSLRWSSIAAPLSYLAAQYIKHGRKL